MFIIHATDDTGADIWLTAPFHGTGQLHRVEHVPAPAAKVQVIAPRDVRLEALKAAVGWVDEVTALENLGRLGCDIQVTPDFRRRADERDVRGG